jgi:hypothetical protein
LGEKKGHKHHPQKHEHCLLRWLADAKKKVGVEQEKVTQVILDSA